MAAAWSRPVNAARVLKELTVMNMIAKVRSRGMDDADARLMACVRDGNHQAFDELMDRYQFRISGFVTGMMGNSLETEDLTQQIFLRAFRGREGYVPAATFAAWLFTIARNVVANARRSRARRREMSSWAVTSTAAAGSGYASYADNASPSEYLERTEDQEEVQAAIGRLCDRQQRAIRLICLRGYTYRDAAQQMDMPITALKSLVCRARVNLRDILKTRVA
jgi:RNA polymerase sigma-70 factor, ECF subfamily